MKRYTAKSLHWVRQNRQPADRTAPIGELAEGLLAGERLSASRRLAEVQRVVAAGTDEEFRRHCSLAELRAGRLTVLVDDPSTAAVMREKWLVPLTELLKRRRLGARVSSICFQVGRSELALDGPTGPTEPKGVGQQAKD